MKQECKKCGHRCHCIVNGYFVSEVICDNNCGCLHCLHSSDEVKQFMEKNMGWFRKQWKKFVDWVFKDFY